jgi:hypothetical protein
MGKSFKAGLVGAAVAAAIAIPVGTASAAAWVFQGLYPDYGTCSAYGHYWVNTGQAYAYDCEPDTGSTYDLYVLKN